MGLGSTHDHFVQIGELVPEAFVGALEAPVVLLSNNPGFGNRVSDSEKSDFAAKMRMNLLHEPSDYPFVFLAPDHFGRGRKWWRSKLKELIVLFGEQVVARSILNVVYFPYPSRRYRHQRRLLPSQAYSFRLVADAVKREAIIVLMRPGKKKEWEQAVPILKGYGRLFPVENPQTPAISRRNCGGFEMVVEAINAAVAKNSYAWNRAAILDRRLPG